MNKAEHVQSSYRPNRSIMNKTENVPALQTKFQLCFNNLKHMRITFNLGRTSPKIPEFINTIYQLKFRVLIKAK